jgi:hypothetical protein
MEFRSDGKFLGHSGPLVLAATYTIADRVGRMVLLQKDIHTNGKPNCQGIPAQYVLDHYVPQLYLQLSHDTLRLYINRSDTVPVASLTRVRE